MARISGPPRRPLKLDPSGSANPSIDSARNAVRHRVRDGVPVLDTVPVPFNMVRLESLDDQIAAVPTPTQTVFQVRFDDVPTQRYMNVQVCPGTLVAFVDGSWTPITPTQDVDVNGNFRLAVPPISQLRITYAWQYLSDGEINSFIDEARQWLREFTAVASVPDGLVPALVSYASYRALTALAVTAGRLTLIRGGQEEVDWSKLASAWQKSADSENKAACAERAAYYTQGPEALDPTAGGFDAPAIDPYEPLR